MHFCLKTRIMATVLHILLLALIFPLVQSHWAISCHSFVSSLFMKIRRQPVLRGVLEPVIVPDISTPSFIMKNVSFYGLKSLHTQGACIVMKDENIISLNFGVGLKNITYEGEYSLKILLLWISGNVRGSIENVSAQIGVIFNETTREPKLRMFRLTQLGDFQVKDIDGAGMMFNWALRGMANRITQSSKESIVESVENKTITFFDWLFPKFTVPLMLMDALGNLVNVIP